MEGWVPASAGRAESEFAPWREGRKGDWVPASAGMTEGWVVHSGVGLTEDWVPAGAGRKAGIAWLGHTVRSRRLANTLSQDASQRGRGGDFGRRGSIGCGCRWDGIGFRYGETFRENTH